MSGIRHLYNTDVTVSRATKTSDGQGGFTSTFAEVGTIRARIRPASAAERTIARRDEAYLTHVLYCDEGEDIQRGDQVDEELTSRTFIVLHSRPPSRRGHHAEIDLEERVRGR